MKPGWNAQSLGDLCRIKTGKKDVNQGNPNGAYPFFTCATSHTFSDTYSFDTEALLIAGNGDVGQVSYYKGKFEAYQRTYVLSDFVGVLPRFLYLILDGKLKDTVSKQKLGNTMPYIKMGMLTEFSVPVPPLSEQQRIVGILDEAFDGISTAKANAEKNLQNARTLFESHLQSVFTQRGDGWVDQTLDQVCIVERGSSPRPIKNYFTTEPDGVNWIKIGDTEEGGKYVYSSGQKITPEGAKQSRFVKEGDFILTNSMSYGRPYIMKTSGYIHDGWFVLRLNMAIDTDYLYYLLSSPVVQMQFASLASGSVVKNISGDLVKKAVLPIPPLAHQHEIVEKLLEVSAETQRLESVYQKKLTALDELKRSLLHQAFSGQL
jgi:type I restriction enzyme, S subunit